MGGGSWTAPETQASYRSYAKSVEHTTNHAQVFKSRNMNEALDPRGVMLRESCDGDDNPSSRAIIIGLDVTASMGPAAHHIAKTGLGELMNLIFERQPVNDPHLMFMGIGDIRYDNAPLQVSQFEADFRIVEQLSDLYVEGGGGGNGTESYDLPWYFAANRTTVDCFDKRGEKGFLFTMGDELPPTSLPKDALNRVLGNCTEVDVMSEDSLAAASEKYEVFHLLIRRERDDRNHRAWRELLGKRAIFVDDYRNVAQIVTSLILISEGGNPEEVISSWDTESARRSVREALDL